jgi:hypothetical protein
MTNQDDVWLMLWAASELIFVMIAMAAVYHYVVKRRQRGRNEDSFAPWRSAPTGPSTTPSDDRRNRGGGG